MTKAERVYQAISRQELDRVPKGEVEARPETGGGYFGQEREGDLGGRRGIRTFPWCRFSS